MPLSHWHVDFEKRMANGTERWLLSLSWIHFKSILTEMGDRWDIQCHRRRKKRKSVQPQGLRQIRSFQGNWVQAICLRPECCSCWGGRAFEITSCPVRCGPEGLTPVSAPSIRKAGVRHRRYSGPPIGNGNAGVRHRGHSAPPIGNRCETQGTQCERDSIDLLSKKELHCC